jgi:hypothetical protein
MITSGEWAEKSAMTGIRICAFCHVTRVTLSHELCTTLTVVAVVVVVVPNSDHARRFLSFHSLGHWIDPYLY